MSPSSPAGQHLEKTKKVGAGLRVGEHFAGEKRGQSRWTGESLILGAGLLSHTPLRLSTTHEETTKRAGEVTTGAKRSFWRRLDRGDA